MENSVKIDPRKQIEVKVGQAFIGHVLIAVLENKVPVWRRLSADTYSRPHKSRHHSPEKLERAQAKRAARRAKRLALA